MHWQTLGNKSVIPSTQEPLSPQSAFVVQGTKILVLISFQKLRKIVKLYLRKQSKNVPWYSGLHSHEGAPI